MNPGASAASSIVASRDRLGMALFLAVVVHGLVILGVGLTWDTPSTQREASMMEVTLARDEAETPPEDPDFLADQDQDGGGIAEQPQVPSPLASARITPDETETGDASADGAPPERETPLIESRTEQESQPTEPETESTPAPTRLQELAEQAERDAAAEAAELHRRLSQPREPSKRFLNARTQAHEAAEYMAAWTRKVEAVGNLNYPNEAKRRGLTGRLILEVTLTPDGHVDNIRIVERSRHRLLDEAAVRIVELGAPFPSVPPEVLDGHDRLVITRTWEFVDGERVRTR